MIITTFAAVAAIATSFNSWYGQDVANQIMIDMVNNEYNPSLDYNGDGEENVLDAIGVMKRYYTNIENGNTYTFTEADVLRIMEENGKEPIYWEIDFIDNEPCRKYEATVNKITVINLYTEYETKEEIYSENWEIEIDPFKELISVIEN